MGRINTIVLFLLLFLIFLLGGSAVYGQNVAGNSAFITKNKANSCVDKVNYGIKKIALKNVLNRYGSPLVSHVDDFVQACKKYDINCYLVPAISGLESGFGRFIWPNSFNAWGFGGGYIMFGSWTHGIDRVASTLRYNYMDKGALTVETIAPIYAESKTWAPRVNFFMREFENEERKLQLYFASNKVEL